MKHNLLLIKKKNNYTIKKNKKNILYIQKKIYSIKFPFHKHYFITTSISKLQITKKHYKILLQLNNITKTYHHKKSINTKITQTKKTNLKNIYTLILSTSYKTPLYSIISKIPFI